MKETLMRHLADASRLTRDGRLADATRVIRDALGAAAPLGRSPSRPEPGEVIDVEARVLDDPVARPAPRTADAPSSQAQFIPGTFRNAAGQRDYKLFLPAGSVDARRGLLVMLHGCTQDPDDFANGTRMNALAAAHGWCVLYPAQSRSANNHGCWNWFRSGDQQRGRGEPSLLAGMTRAVLAEHQIDPKRVHVAGLSAGGAMAVTLGAAYPELFGSVGVHSGLPHGAANDLPSALAAMRQGAQPESGGANRRPVPTIVFHGDRDSTVHPCNGEQVLSQSLKDSGLRPTRIERGQVPGGHAWTRAIYRDGGEGRVDAEHWLVHGAGHAWSGGDPSGSHTDARGPDASAQMLRFFLERSG